MRQLWLIAFSVLVALMLIGLYSTAAVPAGHSTLVAQNADADAPDTDMSQTDTDTSGTAAGAGAAGTGTSADQCAPVGGAAGQTMPAQPGTTGSAGATGTAGADECAPVGGVPGQAPAQAPVQEQPGMVEQQPATTGAAEGSCLATRAQARAGAQRMTTGRTYTRARTYAMPSGYGAAGRRLPATGLDVVSLYLIGMGLVAAGRVIQKRRG